MTKVGITVAGIGESFTWNDLRDFVAHLPPMPDSALYRAQNPKSWWWTPEMDFLAAILNTGQWGNWQRGNGKGDKPRAIKRPKEDPKKGPKSADELQARRSKVRKQGGG